MLRRPTLLLLALLGLSAGSQADDIQKWVDADGNVHFSDRRSAPGQSQRVMPQGGSFVSTVKPVVAGHGPIPEPARHPAHYPGTEAGPAGSGEDPRYARPRWNDGTSYGSTVQPGSVILPRTVQAQPSPRPRQAYVPGNGMPEPKCDAIEREMVHPKSGALVRVKEYPCRPGSIPVEVGKEEHWWEKKLSEDQQKRVNIPNQRRQDADGKMRTYTPWGTPVTP